MWHHKTMNDKLKSIVDQILGTSIKRNQEFLYFCPRPNCNHHKPKLSINFEKNVFKCWICGWSGRNIVRLIKKYGSRLQLEYAQKYINKIHFEFLKTTDFPERKEVDIPEPFISLTEPFSRLPSIAKSGVSYLVERGLTASQIALWKPVMTLDRDHYLYGRIIFPSFDMRGKINYYTARSINDKSQLKYINAPGTKNFIFNEAFVDWRKPVYIVEGIFDAIKIQDNVVPIMGTFMNETHRLFHKILATDSEVVITLDNDAKGKAVKIANMFLRKDISTKMVKFPENSYEDLGQIPMNDVKRFLSKHTHVCDVQSGQIEEIYERLKRVKYK